ncbi:Lrp/AsnC family transcriptional regulator [Tsuneonella suprasediminis]|uniref:Lrp/AsnC family transcriptional regulator n=1 Tax=Tsuneonella suprasediminis TaxID=2306996 RepID=UPI002F9211AB
MNCLSVAPIQSSQPPASRTRSSATRIALDSIDLEILKNLQQDGRISKSQLAERVNLSASACFERMRRLEQQKLILSYHANINVRVLAQYEVFFAELTLKSHRIYDFDRFERHVAKLGPVAECYALGGGIDYLLKVITTDIESYQEIIEDLLVADIGIERYCTYICTKMVKTTGGIPLQAVL